MFKKVWYHRFICNSVAFGMMLVTVWHFKGVNPQVRVFGISSLIIMKRAKLGLLEVLGLVEMLGGGNVT